MKRLNQETNKPFKWGDVREDGYLFKCYKLSLGVKQNGYFMEAWKNPKTFKRMADRNKKSKSKLYYFISDVMNKYKHLKGCSVCKNENRANALQFHHVNREDKSFTVAEMWRSSLNQWKKIKKEIRKCQVVCYSCHSEITIRENKKCQQSGY